MRRHAISKCQGWIAASCLSVLLSCWLISKPLMAQQDDEPAGYNTTDGG